MLGSNDSLSLVAPTAVNLLTLEHSKYLHSGSGVKGLLVLKRKLACGSGLQVFPLCFR